MRALGKKSEIRERAKGVMIKKKEQEGEEVLVTL